MQLTENDIHEALRAALANGPRGADDGFSVAELRDAMGWGWIRTRTVLKQLKAAGKIEPVPIVRETLAGYCRATIGYRFTRAPAARRRRRAAA